MQPQEKPQRPAGAACPRDSMFTTTSRPQADPPRSLPSPSSPHAPMPPPPAPSSPVPPPGGPAHAQHRGQPPSPPARCQPRPCPRPAGRCLPQRRGGRGSTVPPPSREAGAGVSGAVAQAKAQAAAQGVLLLLLLGVRLETVFAQSVTSLTVLA